jgi:sugar phosphate isomerase/epimerase
MHPRLSVSAVSSWNQTFDDDLAMWERLGIDHVGLSLRKCEAVGLDNATRKIDAARLRVSNVVECGWVSLDDPSTWDAHRDRLQAAFDAFGARLVVTTGPAGALSWDDAGDAFTELIEPVPFVALENTSPLRLDLSFVTTLWDTYDVADYANVEVCVEVNSCWAERGLDETLRQAAPRIAHVQLSDWKIGSLCTPDRCVPGDGDIPLDRILNWFDEAGYEGAFELELIGPQIEQEGYNSAIARAVENSTALLHGEPLADRGDEAPD